MCLKKRFVQSLKVSLLELTFVRDRIWKSNRTSPAMKAPPAAMDNPGQLMVPELVTLRTALDEPLGTRIQPEPQMLKVEI